MNTNLASILDRAAAFLRALPEQAEPPDNVFEDENGALQIQWHGWQVWVESDGIFWRTWTPNTPGDGCFDGVTVPPEIISAIKRVTGGGE